MAHLSNVKLNDGLQVPVLGYGTGTALYQKEAKDSVKMAYSEAHMHHIDCAEMYANEESVGQAIKELGVKRDDVFLTTKCGSADPRKSLEKSLKLLGVDQVDLYLIHSPELVKETGLGKSWQIMEELQKEGKTKSIGVSNYRVSDLEEVLKVAKVVPSVNQIEVHPYVYSKAQSLLDFCHSKGIHIESYGPLSTLIRAPGGPVDPVVKDIAQELVATEGQVLLKWAHQITHGGIVLTTSSKKERLEEQIKAFTEIKDLSDEQMQAIAEAGKQKFYRFGMQHMDS
ncbi:hypothetical protein NliqN6_1779 [Naganishia liquefaciens]|uniref:NADP-dependent oxidoreductase domain-containing protein n=1 Tax=Naganishia liquefaciens TaxID=104408 RepID=A0A8H3YEL9_9TREE|nr:hypothetical protein NliqN6_1779 [Naganishia liquefaciens]